MASNYSINPALKGAITITSEISFEMVSSNGEEEEEACTIDDIAPLEK